MENVMDTANMENFKNICHKIHQVIPEGSTRQWDEEYHVIRVMFEKENTDAILPLLVSIFSHEWNFSTIDHASTIIDEFVSSFFGLIPGQIVFTSDENTLPILFAVWWPWGDNKHISLRIGIFSKDNQSLAIEKIEKDLKEWLNVQD